MFMPIMRISSKKNNVDYNNYIKLFQNYSKITLKIAELFENFLDKNKKNFSCYELGNGYYLLELYFLTLGDLKKGKKYSDFVKKYSKEKNYLFEISHLYPLILINLKENKNEVDLLSLIRELTNIFEKYTPFNKEEIESFIDNNIKQLNFDISENNKEKNNNYNLNLNMDLEKFLK